MRRYLLATTLSLAAITGTPLAAKDIASQRPLEVAQAPEAPPHEQAPPPAQDAPPPAPPASEPPPAAPPADATPPERRERQGRRDGGGEGAPPRERPQVREAQPQDKPRQPPGEEPERRHERGGREQAGPQPAPDAPPPARREAAPASTEPPADRHERQERRERARDEGTTRGAPPAREAQTPPPAVPEPPLQQAVPPPPAAAQPAPPPPQAQPVPPAATPAPAAQGSSDKEPGKRHERGDRDRGQTGPAPNVPPQQAQPSPAAPGGQPPAGQSPGAPKSNGATPPAQAGTPPPGRGPRGDNRQVGGPTSIDEIKRGRRQRVEDGGKRTVTDEPGNRTIIQQKGAPAIIRHDEGERLSRTSRDVRRERRPDGGNLTIAIRPGGIEVFSEFDSGGRLMRRYRRDRDGRESNLIDNRRFRGGPIIVDLAPPRLRMPRERYIMDYERASDDDLYDALMDGPVEQLERGYSLDEVRYNAYLRDRMRRVDLDTVTFEFGAWQVPYDQYRRLERIAGIINRILDRRPDEVFLIEGHTDAVGSELDNLTLSDRRAEEVAVILTETFNVPPENLITQGYGEEFLKIPTLAAERANRRVAVRRITPLLARGR